jgi:hypothetical protein
VDTKTNRTSRFLFLYLFVVFSRLEITTRAKKLVVVSIGLCRAWPQSALGRGSASAMLLPCAILNR